jgi:glutaredoxin-like protein
MAQQLQNREGRNVPDVTFRIRRNGEWQTVTTDDLFANRNVVVFSLPGAFTPTCSSTHLPRYNELAPVFRQNGIDEIVCVSVNDPFVMEEWARDQEAANVFLLPDGNGEFTEKMGMLVDKSDLNFGKRSWRYSMLVRNMLIVKMFVEAQEPGDPFKFSDADTMLAYLNPTARKPDQVAILTREGCSFCAKAKAQLAEAGLDFVEIPLPHAIRTKALGAIAKAQTVPQVFVNGELIGGAEALDAWLRKAA